MGDNKVELLAPAGTPEVLAAALAAGADAVYVGGRVYSMRMKRPDLNFSDDELKAAAATVHAAGKRLYVTVNNLYFEGELDGLAEHMLFLQEIGCDALILQDLGALKLARELGLTTPLHASVQMTVNNAATVNELARQGVSRVILSRNCSREEVAAIHAGCEIGLEHFVHGEQCISHSGQCWLSGMFGPNSGNRGRCLKPCRWPYRLNGAGEWQHRLAPNDMMLYPRLREMIDAGIISLKIEGRMRPAETIARLVRIYRAALDALAAGAEDWRRAEDEQALLEHRVRDLVTGSFGGEIGPEMIGYSGEREPIFMSEAQPVTPADCAPPVVSEPFSPVRLPELSVKLHHPAQTEPLLAAGAQRLIVPALPLRQHRSQWDADSLAAAAQAAHRQGGKIYLEFPRIMSQGDWTRREEWLQWSRTAETDGYIVHDLGSLSVLGAGDGKLIAGEGFNITNRRAAAMLLELGAERVRPSLELAREDCLRLVAAVTAEVLVQGAMTALISDHCQAAAEAGLAAGEDCLQPCLDDGYRLEDRHGQRYRIMSDMACRSHILFPAARSLLAQLPALLRAGPASLLIDGSDSSDEQLIALTRLYRRLIEDIPAGTADMAAAGEALRRIDARLMTSFPASLTDGKVR